jgi:endonuclease/exonuclease/phosphatase (EEP) superfamily protein YafD
MKSILQRFVAPVALLLILLLTAVGFVTAHYGWPIYLELLSHFQVQYWVLVLLLELVLLLSRRWVLMLIGLFCCAALATQVLTWYVPPQALVSQPEGNLRIFIANLNTKNRSYGQAITAVQQENPDLAIFVEVDQAWTEQLRVLESELPYRFTRPDPFNRGIAIYSRQEFSKPQVELFGSDDNASVITTVAIANQSILLLATHPLPPIRPSFFNARNRQLAEIAQYLQTVSDPIIVAGDLNITMWSPYYRRFANRTGLVNSRKGFGIVPTWPTRSTFDISIPDWMTPLLAIPIDHCLISPALNVVGVHAGANTGSDHLPLVVDLQIDSPS